MPRLHVLRHAKSSWDDATLPDLERPLAPRGRAAARRLRKHLAAQSIQPQLVVCSHAARAQETLAGIAPALGDAEILTEPRVYHAGPRELVELLRTVPAGTDAVLVIGHNPAFQSLVLGLARPGPLRERVAAKLPTGALATLELDGGWAELDDCGAALVDLVLPRELPD
jgi:phosphohistidine phosphatase